jgi:hypothetical protein
VHDDRAGISLMIGIAPSFLRLADYSALPYLALDRSGPLWKEAPVRVLEIFLDSAHIGQMNEDHQITVLVEPDLLRPGRYRWTLLHSGQAQDRSEMSFATKREADADAEKVLKRRIAAWKAG